MKPLSLFAGGLLLIVFSGLTFSYAGYMPDILNTPDTTIPYFQIGFWISTASFLIGASYIVSSLLIFYTKNKSLDFFLLIVISVTLIFVLLSNESGFGDLIPNLVIMIIAVFGTILSAIAPFAPLITKKWREESLAIDRAEEVSNALINANTYLQRQLKNSSQIRSALIELKKEKDGLEQLKNQDDAVRLVLDAISRDQNRKRRSDIFIGFTVGIAASLAAGLVNYFAGTLW